MTSVIYGAYGFKLLVEIAWFGQTDNDGLLRINTTAVMNISVLLQIIPSTLAIEY